jgi:alpha-ribazole phosphatase
MKIWLVRHAQPLVAAGLCYGALDLPADPQHTVQAAHTLAKNLPTGLLLRASPLQRCKQLTLALQALRPDLTYETEARLSEMNFGSFEGLRWDAIAKEAFDAWLADFAGHRFGGVENLTELMARVAEVLQAAKQRSQDEVWVTHAGVIRAASLLAKGVQQLDNAAQWPVQAPAFGEYWCLDCQSD